VPHACARRRRRLGRGRGDAGRQAVSGRAGVARFCHLIHIITGVSLIYGGGKLIAPVTVSSCLRLLSSSAGFLPPRRRHKSRSPSLVHFSLHFRETTSQPPFGFPRPVPLRARSKGRAGAFETLVRLRTLHGVCDD
jgi:hypothetical protein